MSNIFAQFYSIKNLPLVFFAFCPAEEVKEGYNIAWQQLATVRTVVVKWRGVFRNRIILLISRSRKLYQFPNSGYHSSSTVVFTTWAGHEGNVEYQMKKKSTI